MTRPVPLRRHYGKALTVTASTVLALTVPTTTAVAGQNPPGGSGFTLIDNSHADSWLEIDRTLNAQAGSGTAGSDHDGDETTGVVGGLVRGTPPGPR
ncbi:MULTISPECIES: hypothetical protein [Streptomycetaceae]|uniref:hypothetical protein n=1 Tax=Streptomycetaceae TaxID=2062 RepID=UPI0002FA5F0F|nr:MULTISPECIES: hypothetical protein [Streptomycetaceae]MYS59055.1 hypothetical protein [Streptomyces sp. SID5468]